MPSRYATHKTPDIHRWLLRHPRFHLHFTPTQGRGSTWWNGGSVELTTKKIKERRPHQRPEPRKGHPRTRASTSEHLNLAIDEPPASILDAQPIDVAAPVTTAHHVVRRLRHDVRRPAGSTISRGPPRSRGKVADHPPHRDRTANHLNRLLQRLLGGLLRWAPTPHPAATASASKRSPRTSR